MMRIKALFKYIKLALSISLLVLIFQNCSQSQIESLGGVSSGSQTGSGVGSPTELGVVSDTTKDLTKLAYDPSLSEASVDPSMLSKMKTLFVDLEQGRYEIRTKDRKSVQNCPLTVETEQQLKSLLSVARICKAMDAVPAGQVRCQAIAVEDIQLFNDSRSVGLAPVICGRGTYLCDGLDAQLRGLLQKLLQGTNVGVNCSP